MALSQSVLVGNSYVPVSGFSRASFKKQEILHRFIIAHSRSVGTTSEERPYMFVDTHAGLGLWSNGRDENCLGSPVLIYKTLDNEGVRFRGLAFEQKSHLAEDLRSYCAFAKMGDVHVYNVDNSRASEILSSWAEEDGVPLEELPGLLYQDYEGCASVQQVEHLLQGNTMDILLHFGTQGTKRARSKGSSKLSVDKDLLPFVTDLDRSNWFITRKDSTHGFIFLHGSNSSEEPMTEDFVPLFSDEGRRRVIECIYKKCDHEMVERSVFEGEVDLWELLRSYHTDSTYHRVPESEPVSEEIGETEVIGEGETAATEHRLSPPEDWNPFV